MRDEGAIPRRDTLSGTRIGSHLPGCVADAVIGEPKNEETMTCELDATPHNKLPTPKYKKVYILETFINSQFHDD